MTYGDWLGVETRIECERETIAKKLKRGRSPEWVHEEEGFPIDLIREIQACMESGKGEMYESIMEGLLEDLHDIQLYGESQGRKTVMEKVSAENSTLYNHMIRLEAYRQDYIDAVRQEYARERITMKFRNSIFFKCQHLRGISLRFYQLPEDVSQTVVFLLIQERDQDLAGLDAFVYRNRPITLNAVLGEEISHLGRFLHAIVFHLIFPVIVPGRPLPVGTGAAPMPMFLSEGTGCSTDALLFISVHRRE